jgi:DNA-binding CsgD family transcriptional regulator
MPKNDSLRLRPAAARVLEALTRPAGRPAVSVVAVRRRDRLPLAVRVIPLASAADAAPSPGSDLLRAAYGLTRAEARLAHALAEGASVGGAARRFAVSAETARSQLKAIFAKTGTGRQADLVRLAAALAG